MIYFQNIGSALEEQWKRHNYDEKCFANLAEKHLQETCPHKNFAFKDVVDWIFETSSPQPAINPFGQPPISVYEGKYFFISVYPWFDATPSIHAHGFSGAFTHIQGSSLHSQYTFHQTHRVNSGFRCGNLNLKSCEILSPGKVKKITGGESFIHQLFHLDTPTVTVLIRSRSEQEATPYFTYSGKVAIHNTSGLRTSFEDPVFDRKVILIQKMIDFNCLDFMNYVKKIVSQGDAYSVYKMLSFLNQKDIDMSLYEEILQIARHHHGEIIDFFTESFKIEDRQLFLVSRRNMFLKQDHRLFLGLLINMPDKSSLFNFLSHHFPQSKSDDLIVTWLKEMSENNKLGIVLDEMNLSLCHFLLKGLSKHDIFKELRQHYKENELQHSWDQLMDICNSLVTSKILSPLFTEIHNDFKIDTSKDVKTPSQAR